ncbi:site-specific integrase [Muribaculum sp. NM65_B17]|uniref:site-specific integrase n=1 Tax=Muribaculum sp. NM65_B17 TaxID=2516961 RepID=UPI0010939363|nr:site-specific integrase [Muribaculum sp. NM65_B17]TGY02430.1 site-specific integrase [Muribaculum sp. NM65_B17]THG40371.1 site-specific integrase [Muribaculaceae bacterium]
MAVKKNYRANNTRLIEGGTGDNPKLMAQALQDGRDSLYLEYYFGFQMVESKNGTLYKKANRKTERLNLFLWQTPRTTPERNENNETLRLAKQIRFERGQQLLEQGEGYRLKKDSNINFLDWMWSYYEAYTKGDKRHIKRAHDVFIDFLNATPEYQKYAKRLKPEQLDKEMIVTFTEYLQHRFRGEGPHTLYARFKKIIAAAVDKDVMRKDPCHGISITIDNGSLKKDVLSMDEIKQLITCHYQGESENIRRAFLFCLRCGLRFCDVKDLTYSNVDFSNRLLKFEQAKTKGHSSASSVVIPLSDGVLDLIGKPSVEGNRDELIFPLPSHTMCLKALRHWCKRAGIDKHITWHCARHSFAVNILNNGANIKTVAALLGHSGLKHTEKYTRAVDALKQDAINSLSVLDL